jgi:putative methyltransferase
VLQEAALLHALQFPALQRLVYSTCSIHQRENEDVVAAVLPAATAAGFRLVDPFPAWHRRGVPVVEGSELLVRTDAHEDRTDGFFVAVFERGTSSKVPQKAHVEQQQQQQGEQGHASDVEDIKHDEQKQQKRKKKKGRLQQQEEQ